MGKSEVVPVKINEVEALVGITKKNIRFYEEKGLLSPSRNSENGYRDYGQEEVDVLRRIKLLRKLGVPIEEIRRMQEGTQTVGDGMRRHLVTLERDRQNIDEAVRLCRLLRRFPRGRFPPIRAARSPPAAMERPRPVTPFSIEIVSAVSRAAVSVSVINTATTTGTDSIDPSRPRSSVQPHPRKDASAAAMHTRG